MRFIEQQQVRPGHENSREFGASLHPVAGVVSTPVGCAGEPDKFECTPGLRLGEPVCVSDESEVLKEGELGIQARRVPDIAYSAPDVEAVRGVHVCSKNGTTATRGRLQCRDETKQRCLACTVRPEDAYRVTGMDGERHILENADCASANRDLLKVNERCGAGHHRECTTAGRPKGREWSSSE